MAADIDQLCRERGLTVATLAERAGLDEQRALAIYLGRWTPSPTERQKVAAALGVQIEDIAWGHKTPIQHIYGHGPG
jgi:transcriptional regulator with XRE-family HTH domain